MEHIGNVTEDYILLHIQVRRNTIKGMIILNICNGMSSSTWELFHCSDLIIFF
jgi:hypothetical protein